MFGSISNWINTNLPPVTIPPVNLPTMPAMPSVNLPQMPDIFGKNKQASENDKTNPDESKEQQQVVEASLQADGQSEPSASVEQSAEGQKSSLNPLDTAKEIGSSAKELLGNTTELLGNTTSNLGSKYQNFWLLFF